MTVLLSLLLAAGAAPEASRLLAEGPRPQLLVARDMLARCRFSRIEIVDGAAGRAALHVPPRELGPKQAACANMVAGEQGLADVRWFGPDLRQN